jgi:hypothetical protein
VFNCGTLLFGRLQIKTLVGWTFTIDNVITLVLSSEWSREGQRTDNSAMQSLCIITLVHSSDSIKRPTQTATMKAKTVDQGPAEQLMSADEAWADPTTRWLKH